jgi:hypothetical protein
MSDKKIPFKDYVKKGKSTTQPAPEPSAKRKKGRLADSRFTSNGIPVGTGGLNAIDGGMAGGGIGESLLSEIFGGLDALCTSQNVNTAVSASKWDNDEESGLSTHPDDIASEEEPEVNLVDQARQLFQELVHHPDSNRASILNAFIEDVGVTQSTAVSYYTRFMDEFGLTDDDVGQPHPGGDGGGGMGDMEGGSQTPYGEPEPLPDDHELEEPEDPDRAGFIRVVQNAHLIYKRQSENGTFEELWIYNIHDDTNDELEIRRDILSGTDIPPKKTKSPDGVQTYTSTTMGNAQMLKISGLPN